MHIFPAAAAVAAVAAAAAAAATTQEEEKQLIPFPLALLQGVPQKKVINFCSFPTRHVTFKLDTLETRAFFFKESTVV